MFRAVFSLLIVFSILFPVGPLPTQQQFLAPKTNVTFQPVNGLKPVDASVLKATGVDIPTHGATRPHSNWDRTIRKSWDKKMQDDDSPFKSNPNSDKVKRRFLGEYTLVLNPGRSRTGRPFIRQTVNTFLPQNPLSFNFGKVDTRREKLGKSLELSDHEYLLLINANPYFKSTSLMVDANDQRPQMITLYDLLAVQNLTEENAVKLWQHTHGSGTSVNDFHKHALWGYTDANNQFQTILPIERKPVETLLKFDSVFIGRVKDYLFESALVLQSTDKIKLAKSAFLLSHMLYILGYPHNVFETNGKIYFFIKDINNGELPPTAMSLTTPPSTAGVFLVTDEESFSNLTLDQIKEIQRRSLISPLTLNRIVSDFTEVLIRKQNTYLNKPKQDIARDALLQLDFALTEGSGQLRQALMWALGTNRYSEVSSKLKQTLLHSNPQVQIRALRAFSILGTTSPSIFRQIASFAENIDKELRKEAIIALGKILKGIKDKRNSSVQEAIKTIQKALKDSDPDVRASAIYALGEIGDPDFYQIARDEYLRFNTPKLKRIFLLSLGKIGNVKSIQFLLSVLDVEKDSLIVQSAALKAMRRLDLSDLAASLHNDEKQILVEQIISALRDKYTDVDQFDMEFKMLVFSEMRLTLDWLYQHPDFKEIIESINSLSDVENAYKLYWKIKEDEGKPLTGPGQSISLTLSGLSPHFSASILELLKQMKTHDLIQKLWNKEGYWENANQQDRLDWLTAPFIESKNPRIQTILKGIRENLTPLLSPDVDYNQNPAAVLAAFLEISRRLEHGKITILRSQKDDKLAMQIEKIISKNLSSGYIGDMLSQEELKITRKSFRHVSQSDEVVIALIDEETFTPEKEKKLKTLKERNIPVLRINLPTRKASGQLLYVFEFASLLTSKLIWVDPHLQPRTDTENDYDFIELIQEILDSEPALFSGEDRGLAASL